MSKIAKTFVNLLLKHRKEKDWTWDDLAARAGLTIQALHRIKNGGGPTLETADKIARAFGVSLPEFLAGSAGAHDLAECARRVHAHVDPAFFARPPQSISVGAALDIVREELRRARSGELREELRKLGAATEDPLAPSAEGVNKKVR